AGAALLATSVSGASAAYGAIALGGAVLARGTERVLPWAVLAPQTAFGIAIMGAFLAGYALMAGDEAHILFPSAWFLLLFLVGFLADLPRADWLRDMRLGFVSKALAAAAPFAPLVVSVAAVHARLAPSWIVLALIASAGVLLIATMPRTSLTTGAAVLGSALVMAAVFSDPGQSLAWREKALDSPTYYMRLSERTEEAGDLAAPAGAGGAPGPARPPCSAWVPPPRSPVPAGPGPGRPARPPRPRRATRSSGAASGRCSFRTAGRRRRSRSSRPARRSTRAFPAC